MKRSTRQRLRREISKKPLRVKNMRSMQVKIYQYIKILASEEEKKI